LRESEERLRLAQQAARVGTWEWDLQTGAAVWSDMIWELLGQEPDNQPPTVETFIEFIHPDDRATVWGRASQVLADGGDYYDEFRIVQRDGHVLWLASKGRVIRSPDGLVQKVIGVNIDITELKLAEASLKNALREVQQLKDQLQEENIYLQEEVRGASHFGEIIGQSPALKRVLRQAQQVAPLNTNVLILGETGTGKELLAHAIHNLSPRRNHTLVKINCAALPAPLIESELFGHAKGAFTGADSQRRGRFELANDGTMFLDEVAELPLDLQAKLLRVLEYGEFEMVGSNRTIKVDVRVIAATNRDLSEAVATGGFRSDLYYRLSSFPITLPPLRERSEDLPLLVSHLTKQLSLKLGKPIEKIPQHTMSALQNYSWPGNVRELRNVIERAIIVSQGSKLELAEGLESSDAETRQNVIQVRDPETTLDDGDTLQRSESKLILRTLKKVHWRIEGPGGAAELLDVHPSTLRSRMKKLGIDRPRVQASL
jgi:PAS domain S-box-containing protein